MTSSQVIAEIKNLPRSERRKVIEFARAEADTEQLSPEELGELARQMVEAKDPAEAERLKAEIIRGFYGNEPQTRTRTPFQSRPANHQSGTDAHSPPQP